MQNEMSNKDQQGILHYGTKSQNIICNKSKQINANYWTKMLLIELH